MRRVFDADVHLHERPSDLAPFCEMPWRLALENDSGPERWLDTPGYSPLTPLDPILGDRPEPDVHVVQSADEMRADLDRLEIEAALLLTDRFVGLAQAQDDDYPVKIAAAYNRYLRDRWLEPARGLYGAILLPTQAPDAAAAEVRAHAGAPGVVAGLVSTVMLYPLLGDHTYEPLFGALAEARMPLVLHGANAYGTVFPWQLQSFESPLARGALAQPLAAIANLTAMVTCGVLARHPDLRIIVCEAGVAWLPFLLERLDGQYRYLREYAPELTMLPSEYVRRQVYTTTHPAGERLADVISHVGTDRVLYASDWPHFDHHLPNRLESLPAAVRFENAQALFNLP